MLDFGLNQITIPEAPLDRFLEFAARLGCVGVELRNDLGRPLFDGLTAERGGARVSEHGLRLLGLSQVYPFDRWNDKIADEVSALIAIAGAAGAELISLIPCNDGSGTGSAERRANLSEAIEAILPMLEAADQRALIEPLGFASASLRLKSEVVDVIEALDAGHRIGLVHDTFHHHLAGEPEFFASQTGIVHISGVTDPALETEDMRDGHRVLVDGRDRLGNVDQLAVLLQTGYKGPVSFEAFSAEVHALDDPLSAIGSSMEFIRARLLAKAA